MRLRAVTEEFARDSFENLLFSICRFYEIVGKWPEQVTIVSWSFKKNRFELHRQAILWDPPRRGYVFDGVNDPVDLNGAITGENVARQSFGVDPYGTRVDEHTPPPPGRPVNLGVKSRDRDPFRRTPPYEISCPAVVGLLQHLGPQKYQGQLPW